MLYRKLNLGPRLFFRTLKAAIFWLDVSSILMTIPHSIYPRKPSSHLSLSYSSFWNPLFIKNSETTAHEPEKTALLPCTIEGLPTQKFSSLWRGKMILEIFIMIFQSNRIFHNTWQLILAARSLRQRYFFATVQNASTAIELTSEKQPDIENIFLEKLFLEKLFLRIIRSTFFSTFVPVAVYELQFYLCKKV